MALTIKMLQAMDIPEEKIDQIIEAHKETVNGLRGERDKYKAEAESIDSLKKDLEKANAEIETFRTGDWQTKYDKLKEDHDKLKGEYDTFKNDTEAKAVKTAKENAYKKLLLDAGISDKRIDSVLKVSSATVDGLTLDEDGKIKDADKLTESVKTEWADFITTIGTQGAKTPNPPAGNGSNPKKPGRAAAMVAQFNNEHYGNPIEEG